jgi:ribosome-binding protein aMBF1 (putative translation factor)
MEKILDLIQELANKMDRLENAGVWVIGGNEPASQWLKSFSSTIHTLKQEDAIQSTTFHYKTFAQAICDKREVEKLSLRDLGATIGVSASTLSRLENGEMPDLLTYAKLCFWMNVAMNKFF